METLYKKSLFIFRRDLRTIDNIGLLKALENSESVIPIFIFDQRQVTNKNEYKSDNAIQFMIASLKDLEQKLKKQKGCLYLFYGQTDTVLKKIVKQEKPDAVFVNKDYTPFSLKRDRELKKICTQNNVEFVSCADALINEPEVIKTGNGTPYSVFTPFYKTSLKVAVDKPNNKKPTNFYTKTIKNAATSSVYKKVLKKENNAINVHGGRTNALKILKTIKKFKNYPKTRDLPVQATTHLAAYIKFGNISIREVFHTIKNAFGRSSTLVKQLYWRDFYYHIAYHSPFVFGQAFQQKYNKLQWSKSKKAFERWCSGTTGFPIVDAGMRQLNETGYMHNRTRMIVASFLTKDLHIDWRWGEKYFAQKLVDYDPCVNNGSWQWAASTGADAQPYFRIFNPWLQQKKFDSDCVYIKKWVPELKNLKPSVIHNWFKQHDIATADYPEPMVDHKTESALAKAMYKKA